MKSPARIDLTIESCIDYNARSRQGPTIARLWATGANGLSGVASGPSSHTRPHAPADPDLIRKFTVSRQAAAPGGAQRSRVQAWWMGAVVSLNAGQLGPVGVVVSASFLWSRVRRRRGATGSSGQAAGPRAARGPGRDRRVDQRVPARAGGPGAGRVRPDRAAPPAAARPHGRLLRAGVGAVRRCRLPGGAAAAGGGAAPARP